MHSIFKNCLFLLSLSFISFASCKKNPPLPNPPERLTMIIPHYEEPIIVPSDDTWDVSDVDISNVDKSRKLIAFTFDDAPAKYLENILGTFAFYNEKNPDCKASATLFCNGNRIKDAYLPLLNSALALNFELGNHSFSHLNLPTLTLPEIKTEISQTDILLEKIDGKQKHLFRAPYGNVDEKVKSAVNVPIIDWTIDTLDWTEKTQEEIYQSVWENKFPGAIVLMHDGYPATVEALKRLLPDLKEAGYQVISVSALTKAHNCKLYTGNRYIRARKQTK